MHTQPVSVSVAGHTATRMKHMSVHREHSHVTNYHAFHHELSTKTVISEVPTTLQFLHHICERLTVTVVMARRS